MEQDLVDDVTSDEDTDVEDFDDITIFGESLPYQFEPQYSEEEFARLVATLEAQTHVSVSILPVFLECNLSISLYWSKESSENQSQLRTLDNNEWCSCLNYASMTNQNERVCCREIQQIMKLLGNGGSTCITEHDDFLLHIHPSILETFFKVNRKNWNNNNQPHGPGRRLSNKWVLEHFVLFSIGPICMRQGLGLMTWFLDINGGYKRQFPAFFTFSRMLLYKCLHFINWEHYTLRHIYAAIRFQHFSHCCNVL